MASAVDDPFWSMEIAEPDSMLAQRYGLNWQLVSPHDKSDQVGNNLVSSPDADGDGASNEGQTINTPQALRNTGETTEALRNSYLSQFPPGEAQKPMPTSFKPYGQNWETDSEDEQGEALDSCGDVRDVALDSASRRKTKKHSPMNKQQQEQKMLELKEKLKMFPVVDSQPTSSQIPLRRSSKNVSVAPSTTTSQGAAEGTVSTPSSTKPSPEKTTPKVSRSSL